MNRQNETVCGFQTLDAVFSKDLALFIARKQARLHVIGFQLVFIVENVKVVGHS